MTPARSRRHRIVIADSRSPAQSPLRDLLASASGGREVEHVSDGDDALVAIARRLPDAVLLQATLESETSMPGVAAALASLVMRRHPHLAILLYGNPSSVGV